MCFFPVREREEKRRSRRRVREPTFIKRGKMIDNVQS
jgi:hypothetical protein